jgi:ribonuclease BN (tRNA processing enzyme)
VLFLRNVIEPPLETRLTLAGPVGHRALIEGLTQVHGAMVADRDGLHDLVELRDGEKLVLGPFSIEGWHVRHSEGALGVRVTGDGRILAFSGDSGPCDALVTLFGGADLVLAECSYPASRESDHHLNTTNAGRMAADAGVERLVLTHLYPACDEVDVEAEVRSGGYTRELSLAVDGATYEV